jgi:TM2 domain-containing membrane protein YozV
MELLYIGPGMGIGSIILVFIIAGIVLAAFGYIIWHKVKTLFKKKK